MNKFQLLLAAPAFTACLSANAKTIVPVYEFPWNGTQISLSTQQSKLVDSLYFSLGSGESLQLDMLSAEEKNAEETKRAQLSYQRTAMIMLHLYYTGIPNQDFRAEIVPFAMPHVIKTKDLTLASSKSLGRRSQTHLVFTKPVSIATSRSATSFDADYSAEKQEFHLDPKQEMKATLPSGTTFTFPAHSLQFENGQEPTSVSLAVSEYKDMDAIVFKAMTTTCGGKKLQTAGMWHVSASCDGKPLVMKPGKKYEINVGMTGEAKDMKVFTGVEKNGLLDWVEQTDDKVVYTAKSNVEPKIELIDNELNNVNLNNVNLNNWNNTRNYNPNIDVEQIKRNNERQETIFAANNSYGLQLNDFGWINCDAFDQTKQVADLVVQGDVSEKSTVMLVYGKRKSILPGYLCQDGKSVKFSNIATDETAMLIVFTKDDEKGTISKFTRMVQPGTDKSVMAKVSKSTAESLRSEIKSRMGDI